MASPRRGASPSASPTGSEEAGEGRTGGPGRPGGLVHRTSPRRCALSPLPRPRPAVAPSSSQFEGAGAGRDGFCGPDGARRDGYSAQGRWGQRSGGALEGPGSLRSAQRRSGRPTWVRAGGQSPPAIIQDRARRAAKSYPRCPLVGRDRRLSPSRRRSAPRIIAPGEPGAAEASQMGLGLLTQPP